MFRHSRRSTIRRRSVRSTPIGSAHGLPWLCLPENSGAFHQTPAAELRSQVRLRLPRLHRLHSTTFLPASLRLGQNVHSSLSSHHWIAYATAIGRLTLFCTALSGDERRRPFGREQI